MIELYKIFSYNVIFVFCTNSWWCDLDINDTVCFKWNKMWKTVSKTLKVVVIFLEYCFQKILPFQILRECYCIRTCLVGPLHRNQLNPFYSWTAALLHFLTTPFKEAFSWSLSMGAKQSFAMSEDAELFIHQWTW